MKTDGKISRRREKSFIVSLTRMMRGIHVLNIGLLSWALFLSPAFIRPAAVTVILTTAIQAVIGFLFGRRVIKQMVVNESLADQARAAGSQIEELFAMTDMLQAAENHEDAGSVLMATAQRLMPRNGGALYIFNNSRDRLDLAKAWPSLAEDSFPASLLPNHCWALKRGKPHINDVVEGTLGCNHHTPASTLEVPMMARGQFHGLLMITAEGDDAQQQLTNVRRIARALSDSISLALSNISLREKLRTQSLRDPLTGLYNRRYMEDALERYISLAERTGSPTSVIMIDLDNFKRLNDEFGHAKGDAVLRDVAGQLVGSLRPSDVVARYGGEELMVILPNCPLEDAAAKAEGMRARIESLSEAHGVSISASFGVAAVPDTSKTVADVIPMADAALYAAKAAGKNRVEMAQRRPARDDHAAPRLTATA